MRPFFIVLACVWTALFCAAFYYSKQYPESHWMVAAYFPAFLAEAVLYTGSLFEETRNLLFRFRSVKTRALVLWCAALIPFLIFSLRAGTFQSNAFYLLCGLTGIFAFWHVILPRRIIYDLAYLVIGAAPIITRAFARIYVSPDHKNHPEILGQLMWIRLGVAALFVLREWKPGAFGLWPQWREWKLGFLYYAAAIVPLIALAIGIHDVRYAPPVLEWWQLVGFGIGTMAAFLWVVALSEELFFRGVVERALLDRVPVPLAVVVSALAYGASHLWFRGFPDWRRAAVATLLGVFCGAAYAQTGSVRVPMVTHSLVVVTWRLFFK